MKTLQIVYRKTRKSFSRRETRNKSWSVKFSISLLYHFWTG